MGEFFLLVFIGGLIALMSFASRTYRDVGYLRQHIKDHEQYVPCNDPGLDNAMGIDCGVMQKRKP